MKKILGIRKKETCSGEASASNRCFKEFVQIFKQQYTTSDSQIFLDDVLVAYDAHPQRVILMVGHVDDYTGAPIAFLSLAKIIKQLGFYPVLLVPSIGPLTVEYLKKDIPVIFSDRIYEEAFIDNVKQTFTNIWCNTLVTYPYVTACLNTHNRLIWWIHECRQLYENYYKEVLPQRVTENIKIYTVGDYAKGVLQQYRPEYVTEELLYMLEDFNNSSKDVDLVKAYSNRMTFLTVGTITEIKGQDILLDAIQKLTKKELERSIFIIVGRIGSEMIKDKLTAAMKSLPENIIYIEELDRNRIHDLFMNIDCFVCPSRDDPMPIVVTEAMCAGKYIICSENIGNAKFVEQYQCGFIYKDNSVQQLKELLVMMIHEDVDKSIRVNARKVYEKYFTQDVFTKNVSEILNSINRDKF